MPQQFEQQARVRLDPLQAIKRAFMYRGVVVGPPDKPTQLAKTEKPVDNTKSSQQASSKATSANDELTESPQYQEVHEKLIDITEKAQDILFKADTIFPLTLFPDTIILDREKLTVATRYFFKTAKIVSVPISSISSAEVDVGPFFGSLHMASKYFVQNTYLVNFLSRSDAMKLGHLLQGFIISQEKSIDLTDIDKEDLLILLEDLGKGVTE
jgi:hypothetical protein